MTKKDIIPSLEEVMAEIRKYLPSDEGTFCRGDIVGALNLDAMQAERLLTKWRREGVVEAAGRVTRINAWGDKYRPYGYRLRKKE